MRTIQKVSIDKIAHDIAIAARNMWVRRAAMHQVEQEYPLASKAEANAREWDKKAFLALHPVTDAEVIALAKRLTQSERELAEQYLRPVAGIIPDNIRMYNTYAHILNKRPMPEAEPWEDRPQEDDDPRYLPEYRTRHERNEDL